MCKEEEKYSTKKSEDNTRSATRPIFLNLLEGGVSIALSPTHDCPTSPLLLDIDRRNISYLTIFTNSAELHLTLYILKINVTWESQRFSIDFN